MRKVLLLCLAFMTTVGCSSVQAAPASAPAAAPPPAPVFAPPGQVFTSVAEVAERSRPGVAFISVRTSPAGGAFGAEPAGGVGSGAIIDASGFIVTNNHVVEGGQQIRAVLPDGRTYDAKLIGRDPSSDLAVIKIEPNAGEQLPVLKFGDSSRLRVGEWVVAIGNALGLEGGPTVTSGVVSALGRDVPEPNGAVLENVVQTDAAINPGNSGGPLLNMAGEIIGINTLGAGTTSGGYQAQGINFAISTTTAVPIVDDLIKNGRVIRAYLGVASTTMTPAIAAQTGIAHRAGVIITNVGPGTPAAQAGLQQGDIVVRFGDQAVERDANLRQGILSRKPGDEVTVRVVRQGQEREVRVKLGERPPAT